MSSSSPAAGAGSEIGPGRDFAEPERKLLGSCPAQQEQPNAKGVYLLPGMMLGPEMNAGIDSGHTCGAGTYLYLLNASI